LAEGKGAFNREDKILFKNGCGQVGVWEIRTMRVIRISLQTGKRRRKTAFENAGWNLERLHRRLEGTNVRG